MPQATFASHHQLAVLSWEALGTGVVVGITNHDGGARAREVVKQELDAIDRACSRFRTDSELSRVNRYAGRPVWAADRAAEEVHRDLSCGALVSLGGDVATAGPAPMGGCIVSGWPQNVRLRAAAATGAGVLSLVLTLWLPAGPRKAEWARRSGTPASLLEYTATRTTPAKARP